tara:strand:- start:785 stop:916 length:132 start_codon:yes stop_codon:yes gene_type:complete
MQTGTGIDRVNLVKFVLTIWNPIYYELIMSEIIEKNMMDVLSN